LASADVAITPFIRHRLVTIALLGLITSALALFALYRAVSTTVAMRVQRARELVGTEVERLAKLPPTTGSLAAPPSSTYVGLRGGWMQSPSGAAAEPGLPSAWVTPVAQVVARAEATHALVEGETSYERGQLVTAAAPAPGGVAWAAYVVQPFSQFDTWRWVITALAMSAALLVFTAIATTLSFRRSAAQLNDTLTRLGGDLTTEVPRPKVLELTGIADGIRSLAAQLLTSREVTERLGRELSQQERLAALGRVAAGVAHEVRNPLASIKLRLDLTTAAHALPDSAKKSIAAASDEIARLDRLVSDLLLVAGNKIGPRRALDVAELVRTRAEALAPWAATRHVKLRAVGQGRADADPESVARALDNLMRNAVEASPADAPVDVLVRARDGRVDVVVADHGDGVAEARVGELFEPFFTTKAEGTGLGLAISRAIARAHGGDVTYARGGEVTSFCLSLPERAPAAAA
jgi:signal transduction histidine kinase